MIRGSPKVWKISYIRAADKVKCRRRSEERVSDIRGLREELVGRLAGGSERDVDIARLALWSASFAWWNQLHRFEQYII
jgi:hypothetical protein